MANTIKFFLSLFVLLVLLSCDSVFNKVSQKVEQKVNEKIDKTIDDAMNKMDTAVSKMSLDSLKKMAKDLDSSLIPKNKNIQKEKPTKK